jgi:hypothetical protein
MVANERKIHSGPKVLPISHLDVSQLRKKRLDQLEVAPIFSNHLFLISAHRLHPSAQLDCLG